MTELGHISLHPDDELLVDYFCGQLEAEVSDSVAKRLDSDAEFAARAAKINKVFMLLDTAPAPAPTDLLLNRTLAAVGADTSAGRLSDKKSPNGYGGALAFGMREITALAALVFIVAAILIPVFRHAGQFYRNEACVDRTAEIGQAMATYAGDNMGQLPATANSSAGWLAGSDSPEVVSNGSNLWKLVSGKYVPANIFVCPSDKNAVALKAADAENLTDFASPENISYSYHNAVNVDALNTALVDRASKMAILADRSPVFASGSFNAKAVDANSLNHGGHGQAVLYLDMHADWAKSPRVGVNGDNIWLAGQQLRYKGSEKPTSVFDSFLLPSNTGK